MRSKSLFLGFLFALVCVCDAQAQSPPACREETLVRFVSSGNEVPAKTIGADTCDGFGGSEIFTPKHRVRLYVNFNIAGVIDLDAVDRAYELCVGTIYEATYRGIALAFVPESRMIKLQHGGADAYLTMSKTTFFINEKVLTEDRLDALLVRFYK